MQRLLNTYLKLKNLFLHNFIYFTKFSLKGDQKEEEGSIPGVWPSDLQADYMSLTGDSAYLNYSRTSIQTDELRLNPTHNT